MHWVRFNPDPFKVAGRTKKLASGEDTAALLEVLQGALAHADYDHFITLQYVCYTKAHKDDGSDLVQTHRFKTEEDYCVWAETVVRSAV